MNIVGETLNYGGPTTFRSADHLAFARECLTVKLAKRHQAIANALLAHESNPMNPVRLLESVKPGSGVFTPESHWRLISACLHQLGIATNVYCWCKVSETEKTLCESVTGRSPELDPLESAKLGKIAATIKAPPGEHIDAISAFPDRWEVTAESDLPLAVWRLPGGSFVHLLLEEFLFLRTRYPSGRWHVPWPYVPAKPVQVVVGREVVGGMVGYDYKKP